MHTFACECIEEYWKSRHEGLTLSGSHLCDLTLMEHDTSDELYIVVYHVPCDLVSTGHPMVLPYGIVAFNRDKLLCRTEVAVELSRLYTDDIILLETTCSRLHDCERLRENLIEYGLDSLIHLLDKLVRLGSELLLLVERNICLDFKLDLSYTLLVRRNSLLDLCLQLVALGAELIIIKFINSFVCCEHLVKHRSELLEVSLGLGAENLLEQVCKSHI